MRQPQNIFLHFGGIAQHIVGKGRAQIENGLNPKRFFNADHPFFDHPHPLADRESRPARGHLGVQHRRQVPDLQLADLCHQIFHLAADRGIGSEEVIGATDDAVRFRLVPVEVEAAVFVGRAFARLHEAIVHPCCLHLRPVDGPLMMGDINTEQPVRSRRQGTALLLLAHFSLLSVGSLRRFDRSRKS